MVTEFLKTNTRKPKLKFIKCFLAVNRQFQKALLNVVHDPQYNNTSNDPKELFKFFNKHEKFQKLGRLSGNVLKLLPKNQRTFSNKWIPL